METGTEVEKESFYIDGYWAYGEDAPLSAPETEWEHWL